MKQIHKLVTKAFIGPLLITFSISMLVLLMQFLWKYVDDLVGKGLNVIVILKFLYYAGLTLVPMALPLSVLLASLMTFGNLGERYEIVAAKAAGISLQKLMRPLIVIVLGVAALGFFFSNNVYPYAFLKYRTLLYDIQSKKPALNIQEGEYYKQLDGYVIRIGEKGRDGVSIKDVQMFDHSENNGNLRMTIAKTGRMQQTADNKYLVFTLFNGYTYSEDGRNAEERKTRPFSNVKFEEQRFKFDLSGFQYNESDESMFSNYEKMLNLKQLELSLDTLTLNKNKRVNDIASSLLSRSYFFSTYYRDSVKPQALPENFLSPKPTNAIIQLAISQADGTASDVLYYGRDIKNHHENIAYYTIEWHRKFTLSLACLLLLLVGAPLGAIIRKGGLGMPVVVSILLFISYYILSIIGEKSVRQGELDAWEGMWLASFVFLPLGLFLCYKAITDAQLLDAEIWKRQLRKLFRRS